jgi:hypothetical protein
LYAGVTLDSFAASNGKDLLKWRLRMMRKNFFAKVQHRSNSCVSYMRAQQTEKTFKNL